MRKRARSIESATAPAPPRSRYARWRAATLASVYFLMAIHIVHWKLAGKSMAPLEFNEVMYTAELGIVTAGFLFMLGAVVATAIFGRFFCSWGCHILALQDLCSWLLKKLHITPKAVRSRLLLWVPITVAAYMFAWPQVQRIWVGKDRPELRATTDAEGWASFETTNFWRNLPGPAITVLTFAVCGFAIVYVLGSRSFCAYGCPYGAIFSLTDRIAPGRIRLKNRDCTACGTCTAVCPSHVRVHEELNRFGMVVDPACLKDLDCVSACPKGNIHFGFGMPSLLASPNPEFTVRKTYDLTWTEEALALIVFLGVLFTYRGLYDLIPFFLSIGLGASAAFLAVMALRVLRRPSVQWNRVALKLEGRLMPTGITLIGLVAGFVLLTGHSAWVHYESFIGRQAARSVLAEAPAAPQAYAAAIGHLSIPADWGLITTGYDRSLLGELHYKAAAAAFRSDDRVAAEAHLVESLRHRPDRPATQFELGALLVSKGDPMNGVRHLEIAAMLKPDYADAHYNLAVAYWMMDRRAEALAAVEKALALTPSDAKTAELRAIMLESVPRVDAAATRP